MAIAVVCARCGHKMLAADSLAGWRGKCPKCAAEIVIPALSPGFPAVATPPVVTPIRPQVIMPLRAGWPMRFFFFRILPIPRAITYPIAAGVILFLGYQNVLAYMHVYQEQRRWEAYVEREEKAIREDRELDALIRATGPPGFYEQPGLETDPPKFNP
ncbi:MAG: hypothetical protein ACYC35_16100 [Pirellulales bacterium]